MIAKVKICCISSKEEATMAIRYGASALGLVSSMPSGPGILDDSTIAEIASFVPSAVSVFLLTSKQDPEEIIDQVRRFRVTTIQICDRMQMNDYARLREALPGINIVQVIHVSGEESIAEATSLVGHVDAILLDSGNQSLKVKELGGTGRTHDWQLSKKIRESVDVPLFLAGGLNADNVGDAICQVGPYGVDVCSGVRTDGHLDGKKLESFFRAMQSINKSRASGAV